MSYPWIKESCDGRNCLELLLASTRGMLLSYLKGKQADHLVEKKDFTEAENSPRNALWKSLTLLLLMKKTKNPKRGASTAISCSHEVRKQRSVILLSFRKTWLKLPSNPEILQLFNAIPEKKIAGWLTKNHKENSHQHTPGGNCRRFPGVFVVVNIKLSHETMERWNHDVDNYLNNSNNNNHYPIPQVVLEQLGEADVILAFCNGGPSTPRSSSQWSVVAVRIRHWMQTQKQDIITQMIYKDLTKNFNGPDFVNCWTYKVKVLRPKSTIVPSRRRKPESKAI